MTIKVSFQKVLIKIDKMAEVLLNLADFAQHTLLTLVPYSAYIIFKIEFTAIYSADITTILL